MPKKPIPGCMHPQNFHEGRTRTAKTVANARCNLQDRYFNFSQFFNAYDKNSTNWHNRNALSPVELEAIDTALTSAHNEIHRERFIAYQGKIATAYSLATFSVYNSALEGSESIATACSLFLSLQQTWRAFFDSSLPIPPSSPRSSQ